MDEPVVAPVVEPAVSPVVEPVVAPVVAPVVPATNYFANDGTLAEGWQSTLQEGYREEPSLKTVKDTKVLAKMFVDTKRMVGKDVIAIPTDVSPKEEWDEYYRLGGRPDTVADYGLTIPETVPPEIKDEMFPADRLKKWEQRFFEGGVSKKAAAQFIKEFADDMVADYNGLIQAQETQMSELIGALSTDWGAAFEQKKHLGNIAVEEGTEGDPELKERLLKKFGKDPDFTRYSSNLGSKFSEGKPPEYSNIPTPSDLQTQINELMASPVLTDRNSTLAQRKVITDKVMAIRKKMNPPETTR